MKLEKETDKKKIDIVFNSDMKAGEKTMDTELAFSVSSFWNDYDLQGTHEFSEHDRARLQRSLLNKFSGIVPRKKKDKISESQRWAEKDDLLSTLIGIKTDFSILGFGLKISKDESNIDSTTESDVEIIAKAQKTVNKVGITHDFSSVVESLLRDWFVTDSMILYWKVNKDGDFNLNPGMSGEIDIVNDSNINLKSICTLDPKDVDWDNSLGTDTLKVRVPAALKDRIKAVLSISNKTERDSAILKLIEGGIELKWIDAVRRDKEYVELKNEDGEYWIVNTKNRKFHGLANPSMCTIFDALEMRNMLIRGDFGAAHMMEHFIQHFKLGESIPSGVLAGSRQNWAKPEDCNSFLEKFKKNSKTTRMATNHTVSVDYIYPPEEMFNTVKYKKCESRIFDWSGVVVVIVRGGDDNSKYGVGFLGIKRLVANLSRAREEIEKVITGFFEHESISDSVGIPDGYSIGVSFDGNALKEPRQLLEEIKFLVGNGIEDNITAARELERDPDSLRINKIKTMKENKDSGCWNPIIAMPGQMIGEDQEFNGARPANDETMLSEETRTQAPTT